MITNPDAFQNLLTDVRQFVREVWHPLEDDIDRTGVIPEGVVDELRRKGYFGWSIPQAYGGLGLTTEELVQIQGDIAHRDGAIAGLVNVNTASETVLACLPGIGTEYASALVSYRLAHPDALTSLAWVKEVLPRPNAVRAGPYLTGQSFHFSVDVAAVGQFGRGYARARTVFDCTTGTPRAVYHQDLTSCGWALGSQVRAQLRGNRDS